MNGAALMASELVRRFEGRAVVDGITLELAPSEPLALLGPSGCGKTTLLQLLGLLDRPEQGKVWIAGNDAWSLATRARDELRLRYLGFVFQTGNLVGHLSVRDNVALPAWRLSGSRSKALIAADQLLERFGLRERAALPAGRLSVGEAQRAAVARALINQPGVVLADEPSGSLDSNATATLLQALSDVAAGGAALLVVTHDPRVASHFGRSLHMRDGRLTQI